MDTFSFNGMLILMENYLKEKWIRKSFTGAFYMIIWWKFNVIEKLLKPTFVNISVFLKNVLVLYSFIN